MRSASIVLLLVFTSIASADGLYFHLWRYRLYARSASRLEHWLHTANALLFPVTLAPLYLAHATGAWIWMAVGAAVLTLALESCDVSIERQSRASFGGLTPTEYWMHFMMSGTRWAFTALALASQPAAAWGSPTSWDWTMPSPSALLAAVPWAIALVSVPIAGLHVWLGLTGRASSRERAPARRPMGAWQ